MRILPYTNHNIRTEMNTYHHFSRLLNTCFCKTKWPAALLCRLRINLNVGRQNQPGIQIHSYQHADDTEHVST